jgi:plasmid replication initiation protein
MARIKSKIIKRNDLIEARFTSKQLTLQQNRIVLWLASQIKMGDTDFISHQMTLDQVQKIAKHNYTLKELITDFDRLMSIVGKSYHPIKKEWTLFHLIDEVKIKEETGDITIKLGHEMVPYFLRLNEFIEHGVGFTSLGYESMSSMKSVYSQRIYELLLQYKSLGSRVISLVDLKEYLGFIIKPKELERWSDLSIIIKNAQKECCNQGLFFNWTPIKTRKKITSIEFDFNIDETAVDSRLLAAGLSKIDCISISKTVTSARIDEILLEIHRQNAQIKNKPAWLKSILLPKRAKKPSIPKNTTPTTPKNEDIATIEDFNQLFLIAPAPADATP